MCEIIVIGSEHHNTLGVIRSLGERGLRPNVITVNASRSSFVKKSRYINHFFQVNKPEGIIDCLLEHFSNSDNKNIVIACYDEVFAVIDNNRNELKNYFILPGSDEQGKVFSIMDKQVMTDFAKELGIVVPSSKVVTGVGDFSNISFPCITKPLFSNPNSKSQICICNSGKELAEYFSLYPDMTIQVQDFVDKAFEFQLIGCSTSKEVIVPGYSTILRPCKGSNTSFLRYSPISDDLKSAVDLCNAFITSIGYKGLFSMEFLRGKDGKDYFLETNFRNDGNSISVLEGGVNLPYIWYLDCLGVDYSSELHQVNDVYIMPEFSETKLLFTKQISLIEYITDIRLTNRFMDYDKNDSSPFWKELLMKLHLA